MKRVFSLFLCLLCVCAVTAQIRGNEIRVVVSPDHSDWVYRLNEKCTFTVRVLKAQNLLSDVKIDYELGPEMYPTEVKKDVVLKDGTLKLQGTMKTQASCVARARRMWTAGLMKGWLHRPMLPSSCNL